MDCRSGLLWFAAGFLLLSSCAVVDERSVLEVSMPAADVFRQHGMHVESDFKLGLQWQAIAPDYIAIIAVTAKTTRIIARSGLQLDIDGEVFHFSAERNKAGTSRQVFVMRLSVVERMLLAQTVAVKLLTSDGPLQAEFTFEPAHSAIKGFRETLARIERIRKGR